LYEGSKMSEDEDDIQKGQQEKYNREKAKYEQFYRSKFYTNSQYWH